MAQVTVEDLSLTIDGKSLLIDISFSLEKGTLTLVAGRNGSGKSLLLKCLKGLEKNDGGRILVDGKELRKSRERMKYFGLVFQDTALQIVGSTVRKDIAFGLENLNMDRETINEKVEKMLSLFSLSHIADQNPAVLSGGERRRLSIAGVLAMEPEVVLLDEPLANLDYPSVKMVLSTLVELKKKGVTVVVVSHEAEKLLALTDRTIIIRDGMIRGNGESWQMVDALRENDVFVPPFSSFEELSWLL
ncbi:MAG: energy-coupling factor ABC transporter ATP-binding protein [Candidatus Ornithospirochaeta sp.]